MPRLSQRRDVARTGNEALDEQPVAMSIVLRGRVQGFGVRPAVARLAQRLGLAGSVRNSTDGASIHIEGQAAAVADFAKHLSANLPTSAWVDSRLDQPACSIGADGFRIKPSVSDGPLLARVPADVAVCQSCMAESTSDYNRRRGYVFTTCTECGPRYSLIESMPFDRASTSMRHFTACRQCGIEYRRPADRRFHSQTNACAACGPHVWLGDDAGVIICRGEDAVQSAVEQLREGRILAVRGVGGYQLVVDATLPDAVRELRQRKQRFGKPLAVMVADLDAARQLALFESIEQASLTSPANGIVILKASGQSLISHEATEGLDTIGIMLPTTPLHFALTRGTRRPLVVTSGNLEGDPLAFESDVARRDLRDIADLWLDHDRPIVRPVDDSVCRAIAGRLATVRLARGLAPLWLELEARPMLALGGHQKAAIALSNGAQSVLGPHVGDLETEAARVRYLDHLAAMRQLYGCTPELLVCDEHPDYFSTRWAAAQSVPTMAVQHHHAHVATAMLEHGWLEREVLGIAWDGTGYGPDGTIWGGEFLLATATEYLRVACLRPFVLPGGELAVRQPWRVAVSLVHQAAGAEEAARLRFHGVTSQEVERVVALVCTPRPEPRTSSAGRLFDGVAALTLDIATTQFEGQAAMLFEAACDATCHSQYSLPLSAEAPALLDWRALIRSVLADHSCGLPPGIIAMRFHRALAAGIASVADRFPELPAVLCGGCFHNKVLTELVAEYFQDGRPLATPGVIPCGDGGLAAGQLAVAAARLAGGWTTCA